MARPTRAATARRLHETRDLERQFAESPSAAGSTVADGTVVWTCVAEERDVNEITLGLSSGDLDTNVPGAALELGTQILSGTSNDVAIYIRVENAIPTLSSTIGQPELTLNINLVQEGVV